MIAPRLTPLPVATAVAVLFAALPARAEPWFGWGQTKTEDRYTSGDLDVEDLVNGTVAGHSGDSTREVRGGTWLTVGSYVRSYDGRYEDIGMFLIAGVAFDRVAKGARSSPPGRAALTDGPARARPDPSTAAAAPPASLPIREATPAPDAAQVVVTPTVARKAVTSAWRASGLGVDDARVDSMVARARSSAALPEARFRAMRVFAEASSTGIVPVDTSTYASAGNSVVLEARLTWRFDQLLYANDEPSLERVRLDLRDARAKVATKVVEQLFQWQRAWLASRAATAGTREATDAMVRLAEAEAELDVITGGWFGAWASKVRDDPGTSASTVVVVHEGS